jgi:hypothetical protein
LESIGASSGRPGLVRIERGFIGAHADIGGGYRDNNGLSTVALDWMVKQAQLAGISMNLGVLSTIDMNNPVIHDQSNVFRFGNPQTAPQTFDVNAGFPRGTTTRQLEDRRVNGAVGGTTQRTQSFGAPDAGDSRSMTNADTHQFIAYRPRQAVGDTHPTNDIPGTQGVPYVGTPSNATGTVDMRLYMNWLQKHGYAFTREY